MKTSKWYMALGAIIAWFALIAQLVLMLLNREVSVTEALIRYFSYFTILSNLLVAGCFTFASAGPSTKAGNLFAKPRVQAGITICIFIVGLIYNLVLRQIWNPEGLQRIVDELLHVVVPLCFVLWFILFVDKKPLKWADLPKWLIFPMVYLVFMLTRGAFSGFYPYPFLDVTQLGYPTTLLNCLYVGVAFGIISALLLIFSKGMVKKPG